MFQTGIFEPTVFYTGGDPGPAPDVGYVTGNVASIMESIAGYARAGATRAGDYGSLSNFEIVRVGGVNVVDKVWKGSISINERYGDVSKTAQLSFHSSFVPEVGAEIIVALGGLGGREFGGRIQSVGSEDKTLNVIPVTAIGYEYDLNTKQVWGRWQSVSADIIVRDLLITYAPGFTARNVQLDAPSIPELTLAGETLQQAMTQIADYVGYAFKVDDYRDIHFKLETARAATPVLPTHYEFNTLRWRDDMSQVRTRMWVIGGGGQLTTDEPAAQNILSLNEVTKYRVGITVVIGDFVTTVTAVNTGAKQITISPTLPYSFPAGTDVNIRVKRESATGAQRMAKILSTPEYAHDGWIEHTVVDRRKNEDGAVTLGDAYLVRFGTPSRSGSYETWANARAGDFVQIEMPSRKIWGTYQVQAVQTTLELAPYFVRRRVDFTDTLLLTFTNLLRTQARKRTDR